MTLRGDEQIAAQFVTDGFTCTSRTLLNWRNEGCPGFKKEGKTWTGAYETIKRWALNHGKLIRRTPQAKAVDDDESVDWRAAKDAQEVRWRMLRNRRAERLEKIEQGRLMDVDEAVSLFGAVLKEHRIQAEAIPHSIADAVNPDDPQLARAVLESAIRGLFDSLSKRMRETADRLRQEQSR